ncbi:MAG: LysR family transcriptional regulator [Pusillimonas sp.]|nr:LysR family transcriptional regulator [Alcaligenaceae bacterium]
MTRLDLYDLLLLKEIHAAQSVSRAVDHVGLSQPAISVRLGHLRQHFGDALFVRTSGGMMATPFLESLLPHIEQAILLLNTEGNPYRSFEPATSTRRFRLGLSHIGQLVMLPALMGSLRNIAPNIKIDSLDLDELSANLLESGKLDLAIGYATDLQTGFYQQRLFTENYVCIMRPDHPRIRGALSREGYLAEAHLALDAPGTGHTRLEKTLFEQGIDRNVTLRVPSYLGLEAIISASDLLAIVPARLGRTLARQGKAQALALPFSIEPYEIRQYWHERYHRDAGNMWLRKQVFEHLSNLPEVFPGI